MTPDHGDGGDDRDDSDDSDDSYGAVTDPPYRDDDERAEAEWLLARERDPTAPPPSSSIARDMGELEHLLGSLPAGFSDDGWQGDVLRAIRAAPPPAPRWYQSVLRWVMGGGLIAAAAVGLIALFVRVPSELDIAVKRGDARSRSADDVSVGDHVIVRAWPRGPADLRIYRSNGSLVARCPGGPACEVSPAGEYTIDAVLDAPVQYRVLLVVGTVAAPDAMPDTTPDTTPNATIDAFLAAARTANARVIAGTPIDVR